MDGLADRLGLALLGLYDPRRHLILDDRIRTLDGCLVNVTEIPSSPGDLVPNRQQPFFDLGQGQTECRAQSE